MDESREYFCFDEAGGNVKIAENIIAGIAAEACLETEGIAELAGAQPAMDLGELFARKTVKGVRLTPKEEGGCTIEISALAHYGAPLGEVARKAQEAVKNAVESMSGLTVHRVDISIVGISCKK